MSRREPHYHFAVKRGGKLKCETFRAAFDSFPEGVQIRLTIEEDVLRKSVPQNNLLHHLFRLIAAELNREGYGDGHPWTLERVKTHCKISGCYPQVDAVLPGGEVVQMPKGTGEMDKHETSETIDKVIAYWGELGLVIPQRGEQVDLEM